MRPRSYNSPSVARSRVPALPSEDDVPLPSATVGKTCSGRFNIRVGEVLHERLVVESMKANESLNAYCVKVLKDEVGL
ncbi:MAG: toxin-antitoxin system HicB family antitoxin [Acidobacteria bacterium]|nr:MAG: toxin-antitoxin system HicB family antitoxin [Acidobacteriota bacterium]